MNTSLEAQKCRIGVLTREALVPIGSGPNSTPPLKMRRGVYGDERKNMKEKMAKSYDTMLSKTKK